MTSVATDDIRAGRLKADPAAGELKRRAVRGGVVTVGAQVARFAIQTGATAVLARLLTPADYGLIGMVTILTGFTVMFKDLGLSMATVQRKDLSSEQVNTLFWINTGVSLVLMAILIALAPAVAWFYGKPELTWVTIALAGCLLPGGMTAQHRALLRRQMRFPQLATADIASMTLGMTTAIVFAWYGFGYWALVISFATRSLTQLTAQWMFSGWRPGFPRWAAGSGSMVRFGANLTGFTLVNYLCRNVDNLLIGRFWGAGALGLYSKAYALLLMPIQQINAPVGGVVLPALCRLQDDPAKYRSFYLRGLQLVVMISMPVVVATFVLAEATILTLLGGQWIEAVTIYRVLAVAAFVDTTNMAPGWAFVSLGRTDRQFRWQLFESAFTIAAFCAGLKWGVVGVAVGFSASRLLLRYPAMVIALKDSPVRMRDVEGVLWRPALVSVAAGALTWLALPFIRETGTAPVELMVGSALYGLLYLGLYAALPGGWEQLSTILNGLKELKRERKAIGGAGEEPAEAVA